MDRGFFHPGGRELTRLAGELTGLAPGRRALDVGCGLGTGTAFLREIFGAELWGLDVSPRAISLAGEQNPGPTYVQGDAAALPFPDGSFDAVLMECSLSLMNDPAAALSEAERVLREGGRLAIATLSGAEEGPLCSGGRISLPALEDALLCRGFAGLRIMDRTEDLRTFAAEAIFACGSLDAWRREAEERLGAPAFPCEVRRQGLGYHLVSARKPKGHALWKEMRLRGAFTAERELCEAPEKLLRVPGREIARIITRFTSGSTGGPKRLFFTREDMDATADFFTWGMEPMVSPGGRVCVFMEGPSPYSVGGLLTEAVRRLGAETTVCGLIADYAAAAREASGAECLVGLPGQMAALAETAPELRPRTVLLSGDYIPRSVEERLRKTWGCEVYTHWGMTETAYGGAVECPLHNGCHIREDLLVEIADPETGEILPRGAEGEIVISAPERRAMPLLRYRTGDLGRLLPGVCACGRPEPRLDRVRRMGDEFPTADGHISIRLLDERLYAVPGIRDHRAALTDDDALTVRWDGTAEEPEIERAIRAGWPDLALTLKKEPLSPEREKRRLERGETGP